MGTGRDGRRNRGGRKKEAEMEGKNEKKNGNVTGKSIIPKTKNTDGDVRTYFKVFASFKCSNDLCRKSWQSAHAWEREDDDGGIDCELCQHPAELVNAVDEMLKLDTYICGCENIWQSIHVKENLTVPQECDICKIMVLPDGLPQERFGRHYWLQCHNKECPEKENVEWEDFSLNQQKTQRCTKCYSRGDIFKISKLKQLPPWLWRRRQNLHRGERGQDEDGKEEKPTNHISEFCDMCQDIRRQGKGKNCRQWRLIKTKFAETTDGSEPQEVIVELKHVSDNPFHFDSKPRVEIDKKK